MWAFLDNEAVTNKFNGLRSDEDGPIPNLDGVDPDLWSLIFALKRALGSRFKLSWQRSHAEERKRRTDYHRHNVGNMWSDIIIINHQIYWLM